MAGPFLNRDFEHAVQLEATFNTSPGALVGGDFFKSRTRFPFTRVKARRDREEDSNKDQASVITTQGGRENCNWQLEGDIVPSSNAATPTAPDMDNLYEAHLGSRVACTAHTTTAAGSAGTSLVLTPGGGAASGIPVGGGVIILVDVSSGVGLEARFVVSRATDTVTIDRAFTTDPAAARNVYIPSVTYKPLSTGLKSLHLWEYLQGDNFRHKAGGCVPKNMELSCDFTADVPVGGVTFSGPGAQIATHATARPTPVTAGLPLVPTEAKVFIGSSGKLCVTKFGFKGDNGNELRMSESCSLFPTGVKKSGMFNFELSLSLLLVTGGVVEGYYDNASGLTAYDVIVQLGVSPGNTVALRFPKFIPDVPVGDQDGEVTLDLSGRCYGTLGDDEVYCSFI